MPNYDNDLTKRPGQTKPFSSSVPWERAARTCQIAEQSMQEDYAKFMQEDYAKFMQHDYAKGRRSG
jgi:hypothetical protein